MNKTLPYIAFGTKFDISLDFSFYSNYNFAVVMNDFSEGYAQPFATLTVNLDTKEKPYHAFIDVNNLGPDIIKWLEKNNLATLTGVTRNSGYVSYPEVKFNKDVLKTFNPDFFSV